ncbi:MAG: ParA family protein [Rhizobiaceae bacterium]|uniref:ParA family protein n=1 Tax=Asticcacaulis sp. TaxID=1872648 RepID=UPI003F7BDEE5
MKILVFANQKGGVGKSAIATQMAHYLRRRQLSVLFLDLDHQQNSSRPLRMNPNVTCAAFTACQLLQGEGRMALPDAGFVLIAGSEELSQLERQGEQHNRIAARLRAALSDARGFDVCLIDTNPNPDIRYGAALICADYVLAPIQLNQEAMEGIGALLNHSRYGLARIKALLNSRLEFMGILPNLVESTPFQRTNLKCLISRFGSRLLSGEAQGKPWFAHIPKRSAIAEAQAAGLFLPDLKKSAAREAWHEIQPVFDLMLAKMGIDGWTGDRT